MRQPCEHLPTIADRPNHSELRFRATPQRVFDVLTARKADWFPCIYSGDRVVAVVFEPFVGGRHYEDWGDGRDTSLGR